MEPSATFCRALDTDRIKSLILWPSPIPKCYLVPSIGVILEFLVFSTELLLNKLLLSFQLSLLHQQCHFTLSQAKRQDCAWRFATSLHGRISHSMSFCSRLMMEIHWKIGDPDSIYVGFNYSVIHESNWLIVTPGILGQNLGTAICLPVEAVGCSWETSGINSVISEDGIALRSVSPDWPIEAWWLILRLLLGQFLLLFEE